MPVDNPRDGALDVTLDGAFDGVIRIGGIPVPKGGTTGTFVLEDGENGNLNPWTGHTTNIFSLDAGAGIGGSTAVLATNDTTDPKNLVTQPEDGLADPELFPEWGDTIKCEAKMSSNGEFTSQRIGFDAAITGSGKFDVSYRYIGYHGDPGELRISGAAEAWTPSTDTWYTYVLDTETDGTLTGHVERFSDGVTVAGPITATVSKLDNGGINLLSDTGGGTTYHRFDNYRVIKA